MISSEHINILRDSVVMERNETSETSAQLLEVHSKVFALFGRINNSQRRYQRRSEKWHQHNVMN